MKKRFAFVGWSIAGFVALGTFASPRAAAQDPLVTSILMSEAAPLIQKILAPKHKDTGAAKFEGYFMHANLAQVTVRAKGNDLGIQTFNLNPNVAAQMLKIIDKGGYQYGDKITVYYDPQSKQAVKITGKPSKPL